MTYSQEQISRYLDRIGLEGPFPQNAESLSRIILAHYQAIPYENLDILAGRPLCLEPDALFQKIVENRRGGFCFELNEALGCLLSSLGFSVSHLAARFVLGEPEGVVPMRRHHVLLVHLPDGDYLCDAGVMREAPRMALRLEYGLEQSDGTASYRFESDPFYGSLLFQNLNGEGFVPVFGFTREPQVNADFVMPCFYCEKHPDSPFIRERMVGIYTENGGSWNLVGSSLRRLECGRVQEQREVAEEEVPEILEKIFGIPQK